MNDKPRSQLQAALRTSPDARPVYQLDACAKVNVARSGTLTWWEAWQCGAAMMGGGW